MNKRQGRLTILVVFSSLLMAAAIVGAIQSQPHNSTDNELSQERFEDLSADEVMFISFQGKATAVDQHGGRLVVLNRDTKTVIWEHKRFRRYMDVDPLSNSTLLVVAGRENSTGEGFKRIAAVINWRTGETVKMFPVPKDTHDIDYLGDSKYAVADKEQHQAYILDREANEIVWQYNYSHHYNDSEGGGIDGDYTHLNDIDVVKNGTAVLLSPRNFDRVMLVNRTTKETIWTIGEEDNYSTLYEQHNPQIVSYDPLSILVADSRNHRVVEFQKRNGTWHETWTYRGDLAWPRDADRLPNGNTLIVESSGDRIIEVAPSGQIVWEKKIFDNSYDAEILAYGDEAQAHALNASNNNSMSTDEESDNVSAHIVSQFERGYYLALWVLPTGTTKIQFALLLSSAGTLLIWISLEGAWILKSLWK